RQDSIAGYVRAMQRHALDLTETWRPGETLEVPDEMYRLVLITLLDVLFSADIGPPAILDLQRSLPIVMRGVLVRTLLPEFVNQILRVNRRFDVAMGRLRAIIDDVVDGYRADNADPDLLTILMSKRNPVTGQPLSREQVHDQLLTILIAGVEAPGGTLAWLFHELARHPDVEERLHAEVDAVGDRPMEYEDVVKLDYTNRVIKEVTRLYSVSVFMRRAIAPVEVGGVHIPAGTEVAYSLRALHHDPNLYPEPHRFDPDRWQPERTQNLARYDF